MPCPPEVSLTRVQLVSAAICAAAYFIAGISVLASNTAIVDKVKQKRLSIVVGSDTYPNWANLPVPIEFSATFFNVTNSLAVESGAKPVLKEIGPYVYHEGNRKVKQVFNENGTVTYQQVKTYHFQPDLSVGSDSDQLTLLNGVVAGANKYAMLYPDKKMKVNDGFHTFQTQLFKTKPVRVWLFDGFGDSLLQQHDGLVPADKKPDKFAYFYLRNNSDFYDGVFNMHTGEQDLSKLGQLARWNFSENPGFYPDECGRIKGAASLFPPGLKEGEPVYFFFGDLCASLKLEFKQKKQFKGLEVFEYIVGKNLFATSDKNKDNYCFKDEINRPGGVHDASPCHLRVPIFHSQPHFYQADEFFASQVAEGAMKPKPKKHGTSFLVDPLSGAPLSIVARFQVNWYLINHPEIDLFSNLPDEIYFPTVWFQSKYTAPDDIAESLMQLPKASGIFYAVGAVLLVVSLIPAAVIGLHFRNQTKKKSLSGKKRKNRAREEAPPEDPQNPVAHVEQNEEPNNQGLDF